MSADDAPGSDERGKLGFGARLYTYLRRTASLMSSTPLHPQWFSFRAKAQAVELVATGRTGDLLDIGCGDGALRRRLAGRDRYVGLDYPPTAMELYGVRPQIFGDASQLPFRASSFDNVALLDVLEHLPEPRASLREINRVLRPGGVLYINVPCMYPLHDEPHDYQRPTAHGLRYWLEAAGFRIVSIEPRGTPAQTASLMLNIALSRIAARALEAFAPAVVLVVLIAPVIAIVNLAGWAVSCLDKKDDFMPFAYWAVAYPVLEAGPEYRG